MSLTILEILLLCIASLMAGFMDAVAGGGGLISLPALIAVGIPPHQAIATNKFQACFGVATSSSRFYRAGLWTFKEAAQGIFFTFIGSAIGSLVVLRISPAALKPFILIVLTVLFLYLIFNLQFGEKDKQPLISKRAFFILFGLCLGFYDGFFGPGTGSFWTFAFVGVLGFNLKSATAFTKVMNLTSNLVALSIFLYAGKVLIQLGLMMALAQVVGALLGSRFVLKYDIRWIRYVFLAVIFALILKLYLGQ